MDVFYDHSKLKNITGQILKKVKNINGQIFKT